MIAWACRAWRLLIALAVMGAGNACGTAETSARVGVEVIAPASVEATETLTDYLDAVAGFSGLVIVAPSAGDPDGSDDWLYTRGLADEAAARAHEDGDIWRWTSVTKQLVAVLILQEVEAGRLALDAPLSIVLPEVAVETGDRLTIRHLLQHVSGLPNPESLSVEAFNTNFDPAVFCLGPKVTEPGGAFAYNNCDYYLLGRILEASTGEPWRALMRRRIFEPAGMLRSATAPDPLEETVRGFLSEVEPAPIESLAAFEAAGAVYGDPRDLVRFNRALMAGELLGQQAREDLWRGEPQLGYVALGAWSYPAALDGCSAPVQLVERRGYSAGVSVRNFIAPELGASVVVFVNRGDFDFGEVWMGAGFSHGLLSRALCG